MKRLAFVCVLAALSACAAIQRKPGGFTDGAAWDAATWTDEPESYAECGP